MSGGEKPTDADLRLLRAIRTYAAADDIALRLGYRPARSGRLAVTQMCRALNRRFPSDPPCEWANEGRFITRVGPRDRWGCAYWHLTNEARHLITGATP